MVLLRRTRKGVGEVRKLACALAALAALAAAAVLPGSIAHATDATLKAYLVVLEDSTPTDVTFTMSEANRQAALSQITSQGGVVLNDMSKTIGVVHATSSVGDFASSLEASTLIETVGEDFGYKSMPSYEEALADGLTVASHPGTNAPSEPGLEPLEGNQWNMTMIRARAAHDKQAGVRLVEVGILDSGVDGHHADFKDLNGPGTNVNCPKGRDSIATVQDLGVELIPEPTVSPPAGIGTPDPCVDNQFHGTHVAGIVAAQRNQHGVVGVAPNVELIPVKVCDAAGYCYASAVIDGINYAATMRFEAINMSFFVDDDNLLASTEFKCANDKTQMTFRRAVERAIQYARQRGVTPVAALGNSSQDLAHPEPYENNCEVVPAETQGVIGVSAIGRPDSQLAAYSNYGVGMNDVSAPGGAGTQAFPACNASIMSTFPAQSYGCISGTSMASPHAAGVAALIISQYGKLVYLDHDNNRMTPAVPDWEMRPQEVENYLQSTTIDIGLRGYDECYGNGRVDALKAVDHDTSAVYQPVACRHYATQPGQ